MKTGKLLPLELFVLDCWSFTLVFSGIRGYTTQSWCAVLLDNQKVQTNSPLILFSMTIRSEFKEIAHNRRWLSWPAMNYGVSISRTKVDDERLVISHYIVASGRGSIGFIGFIYAVCMFQIGKIEWNGSDLLPFGNMRQRINQWMHLWVDVCWAKGIFFAVNSSTKVCIFLWILFEMKFEPKKPTYRHSDLAFNLP